MKKLLTSLSARMTLILLVAIALWCSPVSLLKASHDHPPRSLPGTIVGRQFGKWLEAYNSGDLEVNRKYGAESWDQESLKWIKPEDFLTNTFPHTRGLEVVRVTYSSDFRIVVIGRSKLLGDYWSINAAVSPQPPHGLTVNGMFQEPAPEDLRPDTRLSEDQIIKGFEHSLQKFAAADEFSGTVLIAKNGRPEFLKAYGWADKERKVPNKTDTKFWVASISKLFTGVAVVQLAEHGKLSLADPIIKYLPDYPNRSAAEKVTIHHLLTHTSGMDEFQFKKEYKESPEKFRRLKEKISLFANDPLQFEPGEGSNYSNAGVVVLGAVIEQVSGQSFTDYISDNIFKPAGMTNSGYNETDMEVPGLATPYQNVGWNTKGAQDRSESHVERKAVLTKRGPSAPNGGAYSTVEDLLKFELALRQNKLLSRSYAEMVLTGKGELGKDGTLPTDEAYLFHHERANGKRIVGHNGGYIGVSSQFNIYLDQGYTVIALSNYENQAANVPLGGLRQLIMQGQKAPHSLTGEFRWHKNFHSRVLNNDRHIVVYLPPGYARQTSQRYPVLYLNDGNNIFDGSSSDGVEWRVDETAQKLTGEKAIGPIIIVGIFNTGEYRLDEFSPTQNKNGTGGKANLYGRMLVEEIKPLIDRKYRTLRDASNTGLGGASLGGMITLYLGMKHPEVFGRLALWSPTFYWNEAAIYEAINGSTATQRSRIWLDYGTAEGADKAAAIRRLHDQLLARGWVSDRTLKYHEVKGAAANPDAWSQRVAPALDFLLRADETTTARTVQSWRPLHLKRKSK